MANKRAIIARNDHIYIIGETDFEPKHIFENGQAFRWTVSDGAYTVVADKYVIRIKKLSATELALHLPDHPITQSPKPAVVLEHAGSMEDYENFWRNYFDMDRDYAALRRDFSKIDRHLKKAVAFGKGFRLLRQDLFEMIISFILSANNNIPRIKNTVARLSELAGEPLLERDGIVHYRFPTAKRIAALSEEQLRKTGAGYRASYIRQTAEILADDPELLDRTRSMSYHDAHHALVGLPGVGAKVADCILLFGNSTACAFPVDTWVIKLMNRFYLGDEKNVKRIKAAGVELFGAQAGIAQQYLFYYARENSIK